MSDVVPSVLLNLSFKLSVFITFLRNVDQLLFTNSSICSGAQWYEHTLVIGVLHAPRNNVGGVGVGMSNTLRSS